MYYLSARDSIDLTDELRRVLIEEKGYIDGPTTRGVFDEPSPHAEEVLQRLREIDPNYAVETFLPHGTLMVLKELTGFSDAAGYYRDCFYPTASSPSTRLRTARAMVLRDREFGLLDEIALSLLEAVFVDHYPGTRNYSFELSTSLGGYSWSDLINYGPRLKDYLLPGSELLASDGTQRVLPQGLELKSLNDRVKLELQFLPSQGLRWSLWGTSRLKSGHRRIAAELNAVMDDYRLRLEAMELYRKAVPAPSHSEPVISFVLRELRSLGITELDGLRGGISFGDEPIILKDSDSRGFYARCRSCGMVIGLELVTDLIGFSGGRSPDWKDPDIYRSTIYEYSVNRKLSQSHLATGCEGIEAESSRTGKPFVG